TGASATRGGRTRVEGVAAMSKASNSLSPCGRSAAVAFIFSASAPETMWTTNSGTARMLRTVSLGSPWRLLTGTNMSVGGLDVTPLKKENGARLVRPSAAMVETQAMGRGMIALTIQA